MWLVLVRLFLVDFKGTGRCVKWFTGEGHKWIHNHWRQPARSYQLESQRIYQRHKGTWEHVSVHRHRSGQMARNAPCVRAVTVRNKLDSYYIDVISSVWCNPLLLFLHETPKFIYSCAWVSKQLCLPLRKKPNKLPASSIGLILRSLGNWSLNPELISAEMELPIRPSDVHVCQRSRV